MQTGLPPRTDDLGPYFDDLHVGQRFEDAPAATLTAGYAATHRSILGERLRLPLEDALSIAVTGVVGMASPAAVWDLAIGQSTVATRKVVANMFYRGLSFHRFPAIGDTLYTSTEVAALRQNSPREGRRPTGLAALRVVTTDQGGRKILDFHRCAMLPLRDSSLDTRHADDLSSIGAEVATSDPTASWNLEAAPRPGPIRFADLDVGQRFVSSGDVVSSAPELARLTLNLAEVHHDAEAGGGTRLVYGGHSIGIALAQITRELPGMLTVMRWHSCDHVGPVYEGDTLRSSIDVEALEPGPVGGVVTLRSQVYCDGRGEVPSRRVLDWRLQALVI